MPVFPEQLYSDPYAVGRAGPQIEILLRKLEETPASPATSYLGDIYTVPKDKILVLTRAVARIQVIGGMQTVNLRMLLKVTGQTTPRYEIIQRQEAAPADLAILVGDFAGATPCPPDSTLQMAAVWTAVSEIPQVSGIIHGYLIPRANIASTG